MLSKEKPEKQKKSTLKKKLKHLLQNGVFFLFCFTLLLFSIGKIRFWIWDYTPDIKLTIIANYISIGLFLLLINLLYRAFHKYRMAVFFLAMFVVTGGFSLEQFNINYFYVDYVVLCIGNVALLFWLKKKIFWHSS